MTNASIADARRAHHALSPIIEDLWFVPLMDAVLRTRRSPWLPCDGLHGDHAERSRANRALQQGLSPCGP
jgi:hypothetical protein